MIDPRIEAFLRELERALHALGRRERRRALREALDHLNCAAAELEVEGQPRPDAVARAIEAFGAVESIAASYGRPRASRRAIGGVIAVGLLAALTILPAGGGLEQIFISTSNAAVGGCAARWNAQPAAKGFQLAWASSTGAECDVVLHGARRAVLYRQDGSGDAWYPIRPTSGSSWTVASIPARYHARPYAVLGDGQIDAAR